MQWKPLVESKGKSAADLLGLNGGGRSVRVESLHGSFTVNVDENGALICPICSTARFYSVKDLVYHISYHVRFKGSSKE